MRKLKRFLKRLSTLAGALFLLTLLLCLTPLPGTLFAWFGPPKDLRGLTPELVVVLGGGGIPSESGLLRCYLGAKAARQFPQADVLICLPSDQAPELSSVGRMKQELVLRGIAPDRIRLEHKARNTHEQAMAVAELLRTENRDDTAVLLVSSGYHLRRAVLSFRKAGIPRTMGVTPAPAGEEADVGGFVQIRYQFWNNLHLLLLSTREAFAMGYYRLRGYL